MSEDKLNSLWDDLDDGVREEASEITPFWSIDYEKDNSVLEWVKKTVPALKELTKPFKEKCLDNLDFYKGRQGTPKEYMRRDQERATMAKSKEIVVNICYEFVDIWTNRMSQYKPAIAVSPVNKDFTDRQAASMASDLVLHLEQINNWEALVHRVQLWSFIFGEAYLYTFWNPSKGDVHPVVKDAQASGKKIPAGTNEQGDTMYVEAEVKVGEVDHKILFPWRVMFPDVENVDDADWCIIEDQVDIEDLKAKYKDKKIDFTENESGFFEETEDLPRKGKVRVYELYHRGTDKLNSGRYVKFVYGTILENIKHPYSHKRLPIRRITNIDIPSEARGRSFLEGIKSPQVMYNKITGLIWRNIALACHPKWFVANGSTKIENLGNAMTVVEYDGAIKPELAIYPVIPSDVLAFRNSLRDEMLKISLLQGVSVGTPPPNIRSALQFSQLEEQQQRAVNFMIVKRNQFIEGLAQDSLGIAGDYYDEADGRTLRIIGKSKQPMLKTLEVAKLSSPFHIRASNNSGMPEGKFGKLDLLIQLRQAFGEEVVPNEVALDAFEMGKPEQYVNYATVSVEKAESENEMMLDGELPPAPSDIDDHIVEWRVHLAAMRQRSFSDLPEEVQNLFRQHLMATEMLMEHRSRKNNLFAMKLQGLDGYPLLWMPDMPLPLIDPATGLPIPPPMEEQQLPVEETPMDMPIEEKLPIDPAMLPEVMPPMDAMPINPPMPSQPNMQVNVTVGSGEVILKPQIDEQTGNREWVVTDVNQ